MNTPPLKLGIAIEETWAFFHEIHAYLEARHALDHFGRRRIDPPFFKERSNRFLFRRDLRSFLERNEVVFFEWASELLVEASRLPKRCGIVTRLHRYEMYQWAEAVNWDAVDRIILVSRAKQEEFAARFPMQREKVVVIPEAISLTRFPTVEKQFQGDLGILCHLTPRKRVYELILAFYELSRERPGFRLHLGGGAHVLHGDYYQAMIDLVRRLGLEDRVFFDGNVEDTPEWYRKIDVFISNSYSEGLQVSPLEAIASGCYCLSHRWPGAEEMLPEANLYYSDRELIQRLLEFRDLSREEKRARVEGLQSIVRDRFDVDRIRVQIGTVMEEVGAGWRRGKT